MPLFRRSQRVQVPPAVTERSILYPAVPTVSVPDPVGGGGEMQWGMPSHCPECQSYGYLDRIDLVDEVMYQHCPTCYHRWTISKRQVEMAAAAPPLPPSLRNED